MNPCTIRGSLNVWDTRPFFVEDPVEVCTVHFGNVSLKEWFCFGTTWGDLKLLKILMHSQDSEQSRGTRSSVVGDLFRLGS